MTATTPSAGLWSNRRYVLWLTSDTAKGLGTSLFSFALPLVALFATNDPAQAGIIGGVGMAVRLVVTLCGGVLADRHDRIGMMLVGAMIGTAIGAGFMVLAVSGALTFAVLLAIAVLMAVRAGTFEPASESAVKELVPDEAMGRAQAANQGRDAVLQLAGGPLGGALLAVGAWLIGVAMALGYGVAALTAWMLHRGTRRGGTPAASAPEEPVESARGMRREIREGFAWLFSRPDLSGVLLIITVINLGFSAATTTVIYSLQQTGHSELSIGLLSAGVGGVMLAGALIAPALVPRVGAGMLTICGLLTTTLGAALMTLVHEPWSIAVVFGGAVFLLPSLNAAMLGYFMVATPSRLLGRANSASEVLGMGAMPFAPLIAGFGLSLLGRTPTLLLCAGVCAVALLLALANRPLRSLPAEAGWASHAKRFETV